MDLILTNGNIITMSEFKSKATAVAIKNGRFSKIGIDDEVLALRNNNTEIIDLEGKTVLPGFIDSHMHLLGYGSNLEKCDLRKVKSIDTLIEETKKFIGNKKIESGKWILGRGWNQDFFDTKRFPTRYDLDKISTNHPICLIRACGHICVVNSKALELAGINKTTSQIAGGRFDTDETGNPLGIFRENALNLIYQKIPEPNIQDIENMIVTASKKLLSKGITSVQTDDFCVISQKNYQKVLDAYFALNKDKKLPIRVYEQCLLPKIDLLKEFLNKGYTTGYGDEFFKIGPLKLLGDGSLGARTAYLSKPYNDDPSTCGIALYTQEELDELVLTAHNAGMGVAIHAIGDKMMYMSFESIEKAQNSNHRKNPRHAIIHCQITDKKLLDIFKELNVIAHIQPIFLDYDIHIVEKRLGKDRAKTTYNWKSLFNRGVHVACGSDCPVEETDVLHGIYSAITRKDLQGYPKNGWLPEQKLSLHEAIYGFTLGAAYASFEENIKGSIEPNKLADMVVLSENIYKIPEDNIKDIEIEMTFVNGKLLYAKG